MPLDNHVSTTMAAIQQLTPDLSEFEVTEGVRADVMSEYGHPSKNDDVVSICEFDGETESVASTIVYEHEPFSEYRNRARELIEGHFPGSNIDLEHIKGGSFNRIIGIRVSSTTSISSPFILKKLWQILLGAQTISSQNAKTQELILRVPRFYVEVVPYENAILRYLSGRVTFPVPRPILSDMTEQNALGLPYGLQQRLPGRPLAQIWRSLNLMQQQSAVRQITHILVEISGITCESAGMVSPANHNFDIKHPIDLETTPVPDFGAVRLQEGVFRTEIAKSQTTCEFLVSQCERWRNYESREYKFEWNKIWDGFISIAHKLHDLGFIPDEDKFHLAHQDFQGRNVLVEVPDETSVRITGVLDWDFASFTPKFVSYRAPFFFWQEATSEDDDENQVHAEGDDEDEAGFKRMFEDTVDPTFLRYAYGKEYILARRMWPFLRRGLRCQWDFDRAKGVIEEFHAIYSLGPNVSESLADDDLTDHLDLSS